MRLLGPPVNEKSPRQNQLPGAHLSPSSRGQAASSTASSASARSACAAGGAGGRAKDNTVASTSEMARFETETLSTKKNLTHLMDLPGRSIDQAHHHRQLAKLILDMDSSVS